MIFDTENYNAQELQMLFDEIAFVEFLRTKQQYSYITPGHRKKISRKGVDKRLKSIYSPQCYEICGVTLIADKPPAGVESEYIQANPKEKESKLVLIKFKDKYF